VILAVGVLLGFWFHLGLMEILAAAGAALRDRETLALAGTVGSILILSELLQSSGQLARLSQSIVDLFGLYRVTYTVLPALIGLLPMPGGALFTAPLMDDVSADIIPPHKKTLINFWFRHIWEYSWPMYPALLLAASLSQVDRNQMALLQFPLTVIALGVGLPIIFAGIKIASQAPDRRK
jgi:integral membrane protein (TIGR00529 family)